MSSDKLSVVIVGGGVIGCSTAYYLARAGARVTLLEKGPLCREASSASAGVLTVSKREGLQLTLAQESLRLITQASRELETDFELEGNGSVVLLRTEKDVLQQQAFVERQRQKGVEIQLLDRQATLALEPAVCPDILGGMYSPGDASLNPYALTFAFAAAARRLGATIRTGVEVSALKAVGSRIGAVATRDGAVAGDFVVVAAGAWSPILTRTVGLDLPIVPSRGQIVATTAVRPLARAIIKDTGHIYVRPTARGNYVIGSMTERVGFNKGLTPDRLRDYVSEAAHLVPAVMGIGIMRTWAGLRPLSPDDRPLLGQVEGYEGLIMAAGHSRTGVLYSAVTAKMVADAITRGGADFPLDPFSPTRFPAAA